MHCTSLGSYFKSDPASLEARVLSVLGQRGEQGSPGGASSASSTAELSSWYISVAPFFW